MTDQFRSQCLGISLAVITALGCIAYEKLTKAYSYFTVGLFVSLSYLPFWAASVCWDNTVREDLGNLRLHPWAILVFFLSGVTGPIWYALTRKQCVLVGAGYEAKYIVVLVLAYILFGGRTPSWYTLVGITFAMLSIYFISK